MIEIDKLSISGLKWDQDRLWIAASENRLVACYDPATGEVKPKLTHAYEIWDLCPSEEGLWMMTGGGRLGRQLVLWSFREAKEQRAFNCPDGAGAGITLYRDKLWLTHRHNRKLFCLDPQNGKLIWMVRTENETFSPAAWGNELWLIESDPGPLGHWSASGEGKCFFSRYDPTRDAVIDRRALSFVPTCMGVDAENFWYAQEGQSGIRSAKKHLRQL
jgi:outer membrane protein assembly factor BamB